MAAVRRGWLRIISGLLVAAALATVPLWWDAAGEVVRASPLAPAWPWLVPALFAAAVAAITLLAPAPTRRRERPRGADRLAAERAGRNDSGAAVADSVPDSEAGRSGAAAVPVSPAAAAPAARAPAHRHPQPPSEGAEERTAEGADAAPPVAVYEADAFAKAVQQARESVALEGGVYRVREPLYGSRAEPRRSLRRIAEGVITDDKIAFLETAGRRRQVRTPVTGAGLGFDQLLAQYPDSESSATRRRALEDQRMALQADAAVLLERRADGYVATLADVRPPAPGVDAAAGSPVAVRSDLTLAAGDALYDDCLRARRYLVAGPGSDYVAALPFTADRVALLPATLAGGRAYLLFAAVSPRGAAARGGMPWSRETLIEQLNLHP